MKCLTIVDDATTEAVAVVPARALGGVPVTRVLDALAVTRGLPQVLRTDNGLEFCGRAMVTWAQSRGVCVRTDASLRWTGIAYAAFLMMAGQPFDMYWGAIVAPVYGCWLAFTADGATVVRLVSATRLRRSELARRSLKFQ